jgi:hypothetical protein
MPFVWLMVDCCRLVEGHVGTQSIVAIDCSRLLVLSTLQMKSIDQTGTVSTAQPTM